MLQFTYIEQFVMSTQEQKNTVKEDIELLKLREEMKENEHSLRVIRIVILVGFTLIGLIALILFINGMIVHKSTGLTELDNQVFSDELYRK